MPQLSRATVLDSLLTVAVYEGDLVKMTQYRRQIDQIVTRMLGLNPPPLHIKNLITLLNHLAVACQESGQYQQAEQYYLQCFETWRQMTRKDSQVPSSDPILVNSLFGIASLYQITGQCNRAYAPQVEALRMAESLYPTDKFPAGHQLIVASTTNLACLLWSTGEVEPALNYFREAVRMSQRLWPKTEFPNGSQVLLSSMRQYASALCELGNFDQARHYYERAQEIAQRLYPLSEFPNGHVEWERAWMDMGTVELGQRQYEAARAHYLRAVESRRKRNRLASTGDDTMIATALDRIGQTYRDQGDYAHAEQYLVESLHCRQALFPVDTYPGHPYVAKGLRSLAELYLDAQQFKRAFDYARQAASMECELARHFAGGASEAQILNYVAKRVKATDLLMSSWQHAQLPPRLVYNEIWQQRSLATKLIAQLHQRLRSAQEITASKTYRDYLDVRRSLVASLTVSSTAESGQTAHRLAQFRTLNDRKEELERQLANMLPDVPEKGMGSECDILQLAEQLPAEAAFIDFVQYDLHSQDPHVTGATGHQKSSHYGAFVLQSAGAIQFVDLGKAKLIDTNSAAWRADLMANRITAAGPVLYKQLWSPIQSKLRAATKTIYICPDRQLAGIPWPALAASNDATVLLEQYSIATVPSGSFLLTQIRESTSTSTAANHVLAVGDVDYGQGNPASSSLRTGIERVVWSPLPETGPELDALLRCFHNDDVILLTGGQATVERVLIELSSATVAHLATHGFFVDSPLQSRIALASASRSTVDTTPLQSRRSVLERNPFLLSGIVLAGANHMSDSRLAFTSPDLPGILTAQDIVAHDCHRLELVVLSGCRTSLGSRADGSPAGLQTAFHIAGARNVIASLWDVDDHATKQLMQLFYAELGRPGVAPLEALRRAQLRMLHSAGQEDASDRGPALAHPVRLKSTPAKEACPVAQWAAWCLSGPGK